MDTQRSLFMLKERRLGLCLLLACGVPQTSPEWQAVINWLRPEAGAGAGRYATVLKTRLFEKHCRLSDPLGRG